MQRPAPASRERPSSTIWNQLDRKTGREEVIVAFYLRTEIGLCLACSNDRGQTFTDYEGNPVLDHEGARIDTPRPFWYGPTGKWIAPYL